jgi:hypothetical protein
MNDQINIKARWGSREQSSQQCADSALAYLRRLALCDEVFKNWLQCGWSFNEAKNSNVELSKDYLNQLFIAGQNRRDTDKRIISQLGFTLGRLWNGSELEAAHVTIHCAAHNTEFPGPNDILIELPDGGPAYERLQSSEKLREIVKATAEIWDPDWVRVSTYRIDEEIYGQQRYQGQKVGWLTYVSDRYGAMPFLAEGTVVSKLAGGNLIELPSVTAKSFMTDGGVSKLRALSDALKAAGFLEPIPGSFD